MKQTTKQPFKSLKLFYKNYSGLYLCYSLTEHKKSKSNKLKINEFEMSFNANLMRFFFLYNLFLMELFSAECQILTN